MLPKGERIGYIIIIYGVALVLGFIVTQQVIDWKYHQELLQTPCQLCAKLNPQYNLCLGMGDTTQRKALESPSMLIENRTIDYIETFPYIPKENRTILSMLKGNRTIDYVKTFKEVNGNYSSSE